MRICGANRTAVTAMVAASLVLAALGTTGCGGGAKRSTSAPAVAARPDLQRILTGLVSGTHALAPGATAFVSGPHGSWLGAAGLARVRPPRRMPANARVRLESVSKIYTAALILQLDQAGKLRVGDTVERWLPGLLPYGKRITIRELLSMRSGIVDSNDIVAQPEHYLSMVGDRRLRARILALSARISRDPAISVSPVWWIRWAAWVPLRFAPGSSFHYSNIGYDVLGLIAARAGGGPLPELYRQSIFQPLGLRETAYDPQGPITGRHAHGYLVGVNGGLTDATDHHAAIGAGGGIVANARETAAFLTALMKGRLLDRQELAGMRGVNLWRGGELSACAGMAYGWSGGGDGYKTNVWVSGDGSRVAVLLLNARHGGNEQPAADQAAGDAMSQLYCAA
jgi:D-alanyl-D-alanine carboxypeptidase